MNKSCMLKMVGFGATIVGFGAELLSGWVSEEQQNEQIEKKVNEAVAEMYQKETES